MALKTLASVITITSITIISGNTAFEPDCSNLDCNCPPPRVSSEDENQVEICVCSDATYLLPNNELPCSGTTESLPLGTNCPFKGDTTTLSCNPTLLSYLTGGNTGTCEAPENAKCRPLSTGFWGCVFPGQCGITSLNDDEGMEDGTVLEQFAAAQAAAIAAENFTLDDPNHIQREKILNSEVKN